MCIRLYRRLGENNTVLMRVTSIDLADPGSPAPRVDDVDRRLVDHSASRRDSDRSFQKPAIGVFET
jgi:hypothetical protein